MTTISTFEEGSYVLFERVVKISSTKEAQQLDYFLELDEWDYDTITKTVDRLGTGKYFIRLERFDNVGGYQRLVVKPIPRNTPTVSHLLKDIEYFAKQEDKTEGINYLEDNNI